MTKVRFGLVGIVAAVSLAVVAAPGGAGSQDIDINIAKRKSGPYAESKRLNLNPGQSKNAYIKVKNRGDNIEAVELFGALSAAQFEFKYFKADGTNVTSQVGAGFEFSLNADKSKVFRVKTKLPGDAEPGNEACPTPTVLWDGGSQSESTVLALNVSLFECVM